MPAQRTPEPVRNPRRIRSSRCGSRSRCTPRGPPCSALREPLTLSVVGPSCSALREPLVPRAAGTARALRCGSRSRCTPRGPPCSALHECRSRKGSCLDAQPNCNNGPRRTIGQRIAKQSEAVNANARPRAAIHLEVLPMAAMFLRVRPMAAMFLRVRPMAAMRLRVCFCSYIQVHCRQNCLQFTWMCSFSHTYRRIAANSHTRRRIGATAWPSRPHTGASAPPPGHAGHTRRRIGATVGPRRRGTPRTRASHLTASRNVGFRKMHATGI